MALYHVYTLLALDNLPPFLYHSPMTTDTICTAEWAALQGRRPRSAGSNARLGMHGDRVRVPLLRLTTRGGLTGFGFSWAGQAQAEGLLGRRLSTIFAGGVGVRQPFLPMEFALWDLAGQAANLPVYALAAAVSGRPVPDVCRVPCYDTSLYFDDLHLTDDREAAALMASEVAEGQARGHRAFKIKVGRGARWMAPEAGTRRDIAVIRAVREAAGPDAALMLDANNGWTLNTAKHVLGETASSRIHWMEEAFAEDDVLLRDLKQWLRAEGMATLIADGEGEASPCLLDWARAGLVDVVQYDIFGHGLTRWLQTGQLLDSFGGRSAPHHYGGHWGNYAACHLAPALSGWTLAEWDEANTPGLDGSGYAVAGGSVTVPSAPGFGLFLDETQFARAVQEGGWTISV